MKKYEKPVLSIVDIQVRENLAADPFKGVVGAQSSSELMGDGTLKTVYTVSALTADS